MSSRRSRLFLSLRLFFWGDVVLFLVLVFWFFWLRSQRSNLLSVVERQLAFNIRLSSDLSYANNVITNYYFNAASSFVSNLVSVSSLHRALPSSSAAAGSSSPSSSPNVELPPITFSGYFEINSIPYIRVRNTSFRQGDLLLGYPIQAISPDVVQYRDKFFKVEDLPK